MSCLAGRSVIEVLTWVKWIRHR